MSLAVLSPHTLPPPPITTSPNWPVFHVLLIVSVVFHNPTVLSVPMDTTYLQVKMVNIVSVSVPPVNTSTAMSARTVLLVASTAYPTQFVWFA